MTNGNYAFINFQNTLQEPYGKLSDFANPSPADLPAVQSLIFLTPRQNELEAQRNKPLNDRLKALSRDLYNATYDEDSQPLDAVVVRATYDSVDFFMRLLNTSMDTDGKFTCSGRNLALKATNRTFSLRTGVSFIDENGVRQLDTAVYRFSLTTNSMQVSVRT
ncbi:hypothetical protein RvY_01552-4 [Ramazzottius varieornatus]|nr:hypothetical protein RvY_01552-4 [Ramazzottius varieornatus]